MRLVQVLSSPTIQFPPPGVVPIVLPPREVTEFDRVMVRYVPLVVPACARIFCGQYPSRERALISAAQILGGLTPTGAAFTFVDVGDLATFGLPNPLIPNAPTQAAEDQNDRWLRAAIPIVEPWILAGIIPSTVLVPAAAHRFTIDVHAATGQQAPAPFPYGNTRLLNDIHNVANNSTTYLPLPYYGGGADVSVITDSTDLTVDIVHQEFPNPAGGPFFQHRVYQTLSANARVGPVPVELAWTPNMVRIVAGAAGAGNVRTSIVSKRR